MAKWIVFALIALSALPDAFTDGPRKCSQGCKRAPSHDFKFNAQPGHTYVYNFEATTETSIPGASATSEDETVGGEKKPGGERLHITGQAELSAGPECDHTMRLLHVQVTGADGKKFQDYESCEKHPVGFSWNNGLLGDELCVEPDDNPSNLNVKRAILSLMQTAQVQSSGSAHIHETDIFGTCPTDYTFYEDGDVLKVIKRRNLNRCAHREGLHNTILTSSYHGPSDFQSTPILQSSLQVEQTIKDDKLVSAVGHEDYLFRPFSNGASGARTTVTTKLTLVQDQPSAAPAVTNGQASSIIFDSHNWNYGGANPEEQASVEMILSALKNAEKASSNGVSMDSAGLFRSVVKVMRYASSKTLMDAYGQVKAGAGFGNKKTAKAIFIDAILQVGTGQSVETAVQLINSKDIPPVVAKLYYLGLSFVRHATRESLKAAATLLESPAIQPEVLLGVGALVGRYCSEHLCDESVPEYKLLVGKLAHKLGNGCKPVSREHENEMMGALKGLHNAHKVTAEAAEAIVQCAVSRDVPTRIRVAALDAFLGDACNPMMKKTAMEMMRNIDLDSELRIKAYLAVVECPCDKVAIAVKEMLETEPINQVGSFVTSHLISLRTSSNPEHADAKHYLAGIRPKKRYPQDIRKFSRAFEMSYSLDGLNLGSSAEGNVIFSQKSFVPRSAMVNLTTDLFGHSFNLMEVGVRAENVDHVLESLFGPRGYFKMHSTNEVMNEGFDKHHDVMQQVKERLNNYRGGKAGKRGKRSVTREMVDALGKKVEHSVDHDDHSLDVDFHMKLFGSEVSWMNYHGNLHELMPEKLVDKFFNGLDEGVDRAKDFKLDFSPNLAIFDAELVYPTGAGFPLSLSASAHTSIDLKVESHVDIPAIMKDPANAKFKIKLMPSASLQVGGSMIVSALDSVMAGLEVLGTMHSSTGIDVDTQLLENGHGIDIKVGLPKDKQEVFHVETKVVSKRRERHHVPVVTPVKFDRNRKDFSGCFDQLAPVTGLVVCGEVGFPWDGLSSAVVPKANHAMFPLDGPLKASFHIEKEDSSLTYYHFHALFSNKEPHSKAFEMTFDTPGCKTDRTLQVIFECECEPEKHVKMSVKTPWKKFAVEGALIQNEKEKSLTGKYISDGDQYLAKLGLLVKSVSGNKVVYSPTVELVYPEKKGKIPQKGGPKGKKGGSKGLTVEGTITIERDESAHKHIYTFDGVNVVVSNKKFGLQGTLARDGKSSYSTDIKLKYDELAKYIGLKSKWNHHFEVGKFDDVSISTETEFTASEFPDFGLFVKWNFLRKPDHMENTLHLIHGPDLKSDVAHLHLSNIVLYKLESTDNFEVSTKNSLTYPLVGLDSRLEGSVSRTNLQFGAAVKYDKHTVQSEFDLKFGKTIQEGYEMKWEVEALGSGFVLDSKREVTSPKTSNVYVCLELKPGGRKYEVSSDITHSYVGPREFEYGANTIVKIPGHEDYRFDNGLLVHPENFKSHVEVHVGSVCYLDVNVHGDITDGLCKKAEWKVMVHNHLEGSGHYTAPAKFNLKGDFVLNLLKADRKIKGEYSSSNVDGKLSLVMDLFWNADKDPSKKLHYEGVAVLPKDTNLIDVKNTFVWEDKTTRLDMKATKEGIFSSGTMNGAIDLILHNGRHISYVGHYKTNLRQSSTGDSEMDINEVYCDQETSGKKSCVTYKILVNHLNAESGTYNFDVESSYAGHDGKDLKFVAAGKSTRTGEKRVFDGKASLGGSELGEKKLQIEWGGEVSKGAYAVHATGKAAEESIGFKASLDTNVDGGKTRVGEFHLEGHTNFQGLSHFAFGQKAKITTESPQNFDFSSSTDLTWHKDQTFNLKAHVNRHENKGAATVSVCLPGQSEDHALSAEWNHDAGTPRVEGSLAVMWPQGKQVKLELQATAPKDSLALHLIAHTPIKGHEKMELLVNHKNLRPEHSMETDLTLIASPEHKTSIHSRLEFAQYKRCIDLTVSHQGGPTRKLFVRLEKKKENYYESEWKVDWGGEGNHLVAESSARLDGLDQFALHGSLDSPALKANKWSLDIGTKQGGKGAKGGGGGKRIVFSGKKGDDVVFQGSTSFSSKKEGNTQYYEGTGNMKMGDETKNANFKFAITNHENPEEGVETKLNMGMSSSGGDKHTFVGEAKMSTKEMRLYQSYCKDNDKCSLVEAYSKHTFQDHNIEHDFAFIMDLKELFNIVPISMKGSVHRVGYFNLDHKLEVQFDKGKSKYSSHLYLKEHEAGVSLTLPERTIVVIGNFHSEGEGKKEGGLGGFNADVTLWLDKERHPKLKTTGSVLFDVTKKGNLHTLMFYGQFANPALEKPLAIRGESTVGDEHMWFDSKVEFDIFDKKDQTVIMCVKIHHEPVNGGGLNVTALMDLKSKGQNVDLEWVTHAAYSGRTLGVGSFATYLSPTNQRRDTGVLLRGSYDHLFFLVKAPTCELMRVDMKLELSEPKQVLISEVSLFGQHTHIDKVEFKGLNSFKYQSYEKESPDDQFQAHGTLVWGKAMEVYVDRLKGGQKEVLAHLGVALDQEHFFDINHTWEQEKIKTYLSDVKNDFTHVVEQGKKMSEEMSVEVVEDMKALKEMVLKSFPNLKNMLSSYQTQLNELREELLKDPVISKGVETVRQLVRVFTEALSQTIERLTVMCEDLIEKWNALWKEVVVFYEKMMPKVQESAAKVMKVLAHEFEKWGHYAVDAFERLIGFMGQFSGEFKALGKVIVQFLQDVARTIGKLIDEIKHYYAEFSRDAAEHLKAMPAFEFLKENYEEFMKEMPTRVHDIVIEVFDTMIESSYTPEIHDFMMSMKKYVVMKMKKVECDDKAELEALYSLFVKAVKSVVDTLRAPGQEYQLDSLFKTPIKWPSSISLPFSFTYSDIARLPFFFAARFTPFHLTMDDFPRPSELLQSYWPSLPRGFYPPQSAYGILVGGEHFFTFDGQHYSLSGCACNYVLAQDIEDGNFSVAAHLEGGALKSITLVDPKDSIVLNADSTVLVNGQPANLPVHLNTVTAWTEFDSVSIKSSYGVRVTCSLPYKGLCFVTVNGYYFGHTGGLLGTINNEPHDDFFMPNRKVAQSVDQMANAWKLDQSCPPVPTQTHLHEHVPQCSDMFAGYSAMRLCFPIVNPAGYREACDANVAMGGGDPCEVAAAYVLACRQEGVIISVPSKCGQCSVGASTVDQGYTVSLKAPQGKADVVLVVEQLPENEVVFKDLVLPLVGSLTNDLKAYKITDVKFILIGFGGHRQKWPSIFTANGQIGFDGTVENIKFEKLTEDPNKVLDELPDDLKEFVRRLEGMRKLVNVELGLVNYADAFDLVRSYPYRPGAARTVVAVLKSRCLYSPLPVSSQAMRLFFQKKQYEHAGVSFHIIAPLEFTAPSKEKKQMKQVVGLDQNSMYTVADAKKKFLEGDSQFRKQMSYDKDLCVDFAFATKGAAYSSSNFLELAKPAFKKQFMQVVSQRVAQSLAPEFTEDCTCKLYNGILPVTRCWVTSRKERENLKAAKGVKG